MRRYSNCAIATLIILLAEICFPARATTIITVWTPDSVIIGADSKAVNPDGSFGAYVCKIHVSSNLVWGYSGFKEEIIKGAVRSGGTFDEIVLRFKSAIQAPLAAFTEMTKQKYPAWYQNYRGHSLQVLFAAIENGSTRVSEVTLLPREASSGSIYIEPTSSDCPGPQCDPA